MKLKLCEEQHVQLPSNKVFLGVFFTVLKKQNTETDKVIKDTQTENF